MPNNLWKRIISPRHRSGGASSSNKKLGSKEKDKLLQELYLVPSPKIEPVVASQQQREDSNSTLLSREDDGSSRSLRGEGGRRRSGNRRQGSATFLRTSVTTSAKQRQSETICSEQQDRFGQVLIDGRESHTSDLNVYDYYVLKVLDIDRHQYPLGDDLPTTTTTPTTKGTTESRGTTTRRTSYSSTPGCNRHPIVWEYIRTILEEYGKPTGFDPTIPSWTTPYPHKSKIDSKQLMNNIMGLDSINPINPEKLAQATNLSSTCVLTELFYSLQVGLTTIKFAPQCQRCGGQILQSSDLTRFDKDYTTTTKNNNIVCNMCFYPQTITSLDKIGVYFFLNPSVLYVLAKNWGCYPSKESQRITLCCEPVPANANKSGIRYSIGCDDDDSNNDNKCIIDKPLPPGKYRGHCPVSGTSYMLDVRSIAPKEVSDICHVPIKVSDFHFAPPASKQQQQQQQQQEQEQEEEEEEEEEKENDTAKTRSSSSSAVPSLLQVKKDIIIPTIAIPHGRIQFDIQPDTDSLFCLWLQPNVSDEVIYTLPQEERDVYTSATEVLHHPIYANYFGNNVKGVTNILKLGTELEAGMVILLFTDVVGSTEMYERIGDTLALELVKQHFTILFAAFSRWGRVVKTIGDAVMASFTNVSAALEAAAEALLEIRDLSSSTESSSFQIRIGIHGGNALITPLNGINDYFGQTVNKAARIEGKATPSSCLISYDVVMNDPEATRTFQAIIACDWFEEVPPDTLGLKGIRDDTKTIGFKLSSSLENC